MDQKYHAYRSNGDRAGTSERTMNTDPSTGEYPHLHAAGDVIPFDSEEERDAYVERQVVITTLKGGHDRKFHWVTPITTEEAEKFAEACATPPMCIHKGHVHQRQVRIPE